MSTLLIVFGLLALLQVMWCAPNGKITVEIEEGNASYPFPVVDEGEPSAFFLKEVREYLEGREDEEHSRITKRHTYATINSGDTIALQTTQRYAWVSCWRSTCDRIWCPGLYMDEIDYSTRCLGEKFQIFRASGSGAVRVGDLVGIYYPHEGRWLGCASGSSCGKATCPGSPTWAHGFANIEKWYQCYGEVYKIYARGKNNGDIIQHQDDVRFYNVQGRDWLSHWEGYMHRNPCPGQTRPPTVNSYEDCFGETFKIWKRL